MEINRKIIVKIKQFKLQNSFLAIILIDINYLEIKVGQINV